MLSTAPPHQLHQLAGRVPHALHVHGAIGAADRDGDEALAAVDEEEARRHARDPHLDAGLRAAFWAQFDAMLKGGTTILLTTHYMDEARRCSRVGLLRRGRLIAEGAPEAVVARRGRRGPGGRLPQDGGPPRPQGGGRVNGGCVLAIDSQAIGILVGSAAKREGQAIMMIPFILLPTMLLSGIFVPSERLPGWLRPLAYALPPTWAVQAMRDVMLRGWGLGRVWPTLAVLAGFAVLFISLAVVGLRRARA